MLEAGKTSGTDKVTWHGYHRFFQPYIDLFCAALERDKETISTKPALLEIGLHKGASLDMWRLMLPDWHVYGADISIESVTEDETENLTLLQCDQSCLADLVRLSQRLQADADRKNLLLINDDGSHHPDHQSTFLFCFVWFRFVTWRRIHH